MNKAAVRTALWFRIEFLFKVITNPANANKDRSKYKTEVLDLCEAYEELLDAHSNIVETRDVESIKMLVVDM
jgi:hypothetical protein